MVSFSLQTSQGVRSFSMPIVMGIVNCTPDSFYAASRVQEGIVLHVHEMLEEGATIIDIGAMSSRPGSTLLTSEEELERLRPIVPILVKEFPNTIFSIDTLHANTAHYCLDMGFSIVNDISAGYFDTAMYDTITTYSCSYIAMHMQGTPQTMQSQTRYTAIIHDICVYFEDVLQRLSVKGFEHVVLDPGFGFSKTMEQNFYVLQQFHAFTKLGKPLLAGVSRKSMIYSTLETDAANALNGTTVLHTQALMQGASILRVHDVKEAIEAICLVQAIKSAT